MVTLIDVQKARDAIQTKYSRTVASNGILPVSFMFTTQAGLNALLNKTNQVFIGTLGSIFNDADALNTLALSVLDFNAATYITVNRTNVNNLTGNSLFNFFTNGIFEFSDMTIAVTLGLTVYFTAIGYTFTFS